jgi:hypothetical protein
MCNLLPNEKETVVAALLKCLQKEKPFTGYTVGTRFRSFGNIHHDLWHGTKANLLEHILHSRLVPKGSKRKSNSLRSVWPGLLGEGIYLTPALPKARAYSDVVILQCTAALGRIFRVKEEDKIPEDVRINFDSIYAEGEVKFAWTGKLVFPEYCVFYPEQVLIDRIFLEEEEKLTINTETQPGHPCRKKGVACYYASVQQAVSRRKFTCLLQGKVKEINEMCGKYKKWKK